MEKSFDPPVLVQRVFAGLIGVAFVVRLIVEPNLRNALWLLTICTLSAVTVISPKGVRDGRLTAWERRHPIWVGAGAAVFGGLVAFLGFSMFLDDRLSAAISVVLGLIYGGVAGYRASHRVG